MMPTSDKTTNESANSTPQKTTSDGTMSSECHLARLAELEQYLRSEVGRQLRIATTPGASVAVMSADLSIMDRWAESVRWAIEELSG